MEKILRVMMDAIANEVCGRTFDKSLYALSDEELMRLYHLSKTHDLAHLVGDVLVKNDLVTNSEIKARFQKQGVLVVYRYEKINSELNRLREVLNEAKIPFMPLKGAVIRQYYPEPWMRTSCDIDILVHQEDAETAAELLATRLAYKRDRQGPHDIGLYSAGGLHLELHYRLIERNVTERMGTVLQSVWEKARCAADTSEYVLPDEWFYYYHIAHMAKHFVSTGGCGIRPFLDIWILNHRVPHAPERRDALLQQGGLLSFASEAEELSEVWFGDAAYTDIERQMENYVLKGGLYGSVENRVAVQQVKKGGKIRYAFSRLWLPYDTLKFLYPSLTHKRALLPLYEVRRWCNLLCLGRAGRSMRELKLNFSTTNDEQGRVDEMLVKLGLENEKR